ncbi:Transmembrane_domain-containing protein [Hexamita inflata]|uniref:Transmembrane domain-containing protein n=1 Tax=Hexamita inflata TaxID=28002 RepID=A0AA86TGR5_9EUKA|nr:Transmembrane domain-containing protein [Hexamita inflata]CAI9946882.1 Transmembrane domain-containing protein [Hexamita inflata]CAI9967230.1 Transmembrane domain-containing protein [Hexamita inflata]
MEQEKKKCSPVLLNVLRIIPEIILSFVLFLAEIFIIYLFIGFDNKKWAKWGTNMISGISMSACYMVFTYQSPFWLSVYAKHSAIANFLVFNLIGFPVGFAMYFFDDYVIRFFTNCDYVEGGVCFHSQMIFFTLGLNTTYFNGNLIKGSSLSSALLWYIISWMVFVVFGGYITKATKFSDPSYPNEYLIVGSFLCSFIFTNLTKLSIFSEFDFTRVFIYNTKTYMLVSGLVIAGVQYIIFYTVSYYCLYNSPHTFMANTAWSMLTYTWVAQIIVGRTVAHDLFVALVQKKHYHPGWVILFVIVTFGISYALIPILFFIYQKVIFKYILQKVMGMTDWGANTRYDFAYNFGAGNLMLVLNGLTWFSRKNQQRLAAAAQEQSDSANANMNRQSLEESQSQYSQSNQIPLLNAKYPVEAILEDSEVDFGMRR